MKTRHQHPALEHQRRLDHVGHAGRHVGVSDGRFHRSDIQRRIRRPGTDHRFDGPKLDAVSQIRSRTMGFVIGNVVRRKFRNRKDRLEALLLTEYAGRCKSRLSVSVVIYERTADHRDDVIVIRFRIFIPLQHYYSGCRSRHQSIGVPVKWPDLTLSRFRRQIVGIPLLLRFCRDSSGQRHIALVIQKGLTRLVDRIERRCARVLRHDRRPRKS